MSRASSPRAPRVLSTARQNPEFALRVARELPESARRGFVARLVEPEPRAAAARPGLAKCPRSPFAEANGYALGLALFARHSHR